MANYCRSEKYDTFMFSPAMYVDGQFGNVTKTRLQNFLCFVGYYEGYIDGVDGSMTWSGLRKYLQSRGFYWTTANTQISA